MLLFMQMDYQSIADLMAAPPNKEQRTYRGWWCYRKPPMQTFLDTASLAKEKALASAS